MVQVASRSTVYCRPPGTRSRVPRSPLLKQKPVKFPRSRHGVLTHTSSNCLSPVHRIWEQRPRTNWVRISWLCIAFCAEFLKWSQRCVLWAAAARQCVCESCRHTPLLCDSQVSDTAECCCTPNKKVLLLMTPYISRFFSWNWGKGKSCEPQWTVRHIGNFVNILRVLMCVCCYLFVLCVERSYCLIENWLQFKLSFHVRDSIYIIFNRIFIIYFFAAFAVSVALLLLDRCRWVKWLRYNLIVLHVSFSMFKLLGPALYSWGPLTALKFAFVRQQWHRISSSGAGNPINIKK